MTLQEIEQIVCGNIGRVYSAIAASATDFALLHKCVWMAREEIKVATIILGILKKYTGLTIVANTKAYSLPSDFDLPVKLFYITSDGTEIELEQVWLDTLLDKCDLDDIGTPSHYMIMGNVADVIQIEFYDTPDTSDESVYIYYKPILENKTATTDETVIMKKYPLTVIKFATAFAGRLLIKNDEIFNKFYTLGDLDISKINRREINADTHFKERPDSLTRKRRQARFSQ